MARSRLELAGLKFGRLLALEATHKRSKARHIIWRCVCDCTRQVDVVSSMLATGRTQSCPQCYHSLKCEA